jgi:excisionase family DNA binding protein
VLNIALTAAETLDRLGTKGDSETTLSRESRGVLRTTPPKQHRRRASQGQEGGRAMSGEPVAQPPQYITTTEAAVMAHCHPETVRRAFNSGQLRGWKFLGQWRTTHKHVEKWVRAHGPGRRSTNTEQEQ